MTILINITEEPIETKHISWNVFEDGNSLVLVEIVENYYDHPNAPGYALIPRLETVERKRVIKGTRAAAPLNQLKDALDTVMLIYGERNG